MQPKRSTLIAIPCLAAALYAGLWALPRVTAWRAERRMARYTSNHYDVRYSPSEFTSDTIRSLVDHHEALLASEAERLHISERKLRLHAILLGDFDSQRAATRSDSPYTVDGTTIHAVLAGYVQHLDPAADAAALLNTAWGRPGSPLLGRWVARWAAGEWRGRSVDSWAAQMESELGHFTLRDLLEGVPEGELSPLVREPLGAAWLGSVYEQFGVPGVRKLYETPEPDANLPGVSDRLGVSPADLERAWSGRAVALQAEYPPPPGRAFRFDANFFFRGVSLSSESWAEGRGGYASQVAAKQIESLREMGANAIAIVPYGFVRSATPAELFYTGTDESDEDLSEAAWRAHQLGMKVMLKPQLWVSRGRFTGKIEFQDPEEQARWLRSYREFILHYARLAELERMDLLCIGNELGGVTRDEAGWRQIIADVRRVYHGPLTYAANWGGELSRVRFWDALDYIGVNNYYPLASQPSPNPANLLPGANSLATMLKDVSRMGRKPLLFTEVGYPSVQGAAVEPWVEDSDRNVSDAEQAACYQAVFRAFGGRRWFRGMFWWKWPSDGQGGGPDDGAYTPLGKPAAEVIRTWYTRMAAAQASRPAAAP